MFIVVLLLIVSIGFPVFYAWRIWRLDEPTVLSWLLVVADACVFLALIMLIGRWDIAGYYVRFVLLALAGTSIAVSFVRHARRPWVTAEERELRSAHLITMVSLITFGAAVVYMASGLVSPAQMRDLAFPLRDGRFMVAQGGGVMLLNQHAGHKAQQFAADITAINAAGFRAPGILPAELDRYEIFGKEVVSPCKGTVSGVLDGLADLTPPSSDSENPAGNHVVLTCNAMQIELAHLQRGSISVALGEKVEVGDVLGSVGNSGNTTEPHLHIHAVNPATGAGVPISFKGRFPVRNRLYVE